MLSRHRADALAGVSDFELVQHAYALVPRVDDELLADDLYVAMTEIFERFAPEAERADLEARHAGVPNADVEIEDSLQAIERRALLRDLHRGVREVSHG